MRTKQAERMAEKTEIEARTKRIRRLGEIAGLEAEVQALEDEEAEEFTHTGSNSSELTRPPEGAKGLPESTNQKVDDPVNHLSNADRSVEWIRTYTTEENGYCSQRKEPNTFEPHLGATGNLEPRLGATGQSDPQWRATDKKEESYRTSESVAGARTVTFDTANGGSCALKQIDTAGFDDRRQSTRG